MVTVQRVAWHEPRPAAVPPVGRLDVVIAGAYAAAVVAEGVVRPSPVWPVVATVLALAVAPALLWRRQHPLVAVVAGWGVAGCFSLLQLLAGSADVGPSAMLVVLVLLFALVRWGSGCEVLLGAAVVAVVVVLGLYAASAGGAEVFGGIVLVLLVAALAAVFRYRAEAWLRQQREIRNEERVALARELHDTVAHHVSAIAVQAQGGGVVAVAQPARAVEVLAAIEAEASRTLTEMRAMVRVLRDDDADDLAPRRGVGDLPALARSGETPDVVVHVDGSATGLPAAVDAALYRLAQESVTNARRHARGATRVTIEVRRDGDVVRLRVGDDGATGARAGAEPGYGLQGMRERAELLGGTLVAGPAPGGGWTVEAALPVVES
ncbi:sensor histidine kinase [Nocardioides marmoraquaticus]